MADKKQKIECIGCGKTYDVTLGDGGAEPQTAVVKCECGATTTVTRSGAPGGKSDDIMGALNGVLGRISPILKDFRESKMKGVDTGLGEAIHDATKELVRVVLEEDAELRGALKAWVHESLRQNLLVRAEDGVSAAGGEGTQA